MSLRSNFLMRPVNRTARLFQQTLVGVSRKFQQNLRLSHSTRDELELQLWNYTSSVVFVLFGLALFCSLFVFNLRQVFYSSCSFNHFCSKILLQIHKWVKQKTLENMKNIVVIFLLLAGTSWNFGSISSVPFSLFGWRNRMYAYAMLQWSSVQFQVDRVYNRQ